MYAKKHSTSGNHSGLVANVVALVFTIAGMSLIGIALASQRQAPQPPQAAGANQAIGVVNGYGPWWRTTFPAIRPSEILSTTVVGPTLPRSKPVTLDIPSIDVHSTVQYLGRTADGALETPAPGPHYNEAAWYRYSPTPGSLGPAILLGHVDSAADGPSVFFRLGDLGRGDHVSITRADGSIAVFKVDAISRYAKDDFPTELVYNDINHAGLRIVTCGGAFDDATGHYLDNIVVFASLVDSRES
jgi:hypothetical protein